MDQIHLLSLVSSALFPVINLVFFSFFFLARKALAVDENFTICRVPRFCGRMEIRFPFFIQEIQESRCGSPGFNISCRNNTDPILSLSDAEYVIHDIFYPNKSILVSKAVSVCSPSIIRNISFPEDRFYYPEDQRQIFLLFNCNLTLQSTWGLSQYKVACSAQNQTSATLALFEDDPQLNKASAYCNNAMAVPVAFPQEEGGVENMMNSGFLLKWIASDCSVCEKSGGKCGFDYGTYHFKCFCPDRPHASDCDPGNKKLKLKLGLGIGCPVTLIILISIFAVLCRRKQKYGYFLKGNTSSNLSSKSDLECSSTICFGIPIFKYGELVEATNNFDHEKELGDGGFGIVYRGKLRDGREVAIKRLYRQNYRRLQQFVNEVEILTRLRHRNLVSLYGCTSSRSQELLLVYEFISNGTVADHLHGDHAESGSLTWPIRMSIAIETATALAYLHASGIIHRDVKTNNILLDDNFSVKVADFGLSRLFPTDVTHISTAPQGTPGYVDPEYHQCYQLTEKSDVYSFGVVLIELISSMPAVDISRHRHEINLANLAISKIQKSAFDELIDPTLGHKSDEEITRMTTAVAELAFRCLQQEKEMRPSMEDVLEELQKIQRGDCELEDHIDTHTVQGDVPPPSPANGDQIALLKNNRMPPSPVSVADKWISRSTTPNTSG